MRRSRAAAFRSLVLTSSLLVVGCGPEAAQANAPCSACAAATNAGTQRPDAGSATASSASPSSSSLPAPAADGGLRELVKRVFVRDTRADCMGEGPRKCMQVRESESDAWTLFYDRIEGFTYEEGHAYELRVALEPHPNPPADGSSLRYRLIEIVSKQKVSAPSR